MLQAWLISSFVSSLSTSPKENNPLLKVAAAATTKTSGPSPTVKILSTSPIEITKDHKYYDTIYDEQPQSSSTSFPLAALLISTSVVGSVMFFTLPFIVMPFISGQSLPYMATPKKKIQQALQFIRQRTNDKRGSGKKSRQFLDLGSGDGETVYQALKLLNAQSSKIPQNHHDEYYNYYYTKCVGIELNTTLYVWSCLRRMMFWTRPEQLRSQFICQNMFHQPTNHTNSGQHDHPSTCSKSNSNTANDAPLWIRQSDTILIFGIPSLMVPLSQLLAQHQCQSGTYILSYRFPLPTYDNHPNNNNVKERSTLLPARLIYDQEEMRIYECTGTTTSGDGTNDIDNLEKKVEEGQR